MTRKTLTNGHSDARLSDRILASALIKLLNASQMPFALANQAGEILIANELFKAWNAESTIELKSLQSDMSTVLLSRKEASLPFRLKDGTVIVKLLPLLDDVGHPLLEGTVGVLVRRLGSSPALDPTWLEHLFDLTARESEVALAVASGQTVSEIANEAEVSESTVRVQLKAIFRKVGVKSQVELASRIYT